MLDASANTLTYSIVAAGTNSASVDHDLFAINTATGALTFAAAPNFEALGCGANNNANGCVVDSISNRCNSCAQQMIQSQLL
jgi:hypothetical protein